MIQHPFGGGPEGIKKKSVGSTTPIANKLLMLPLSYRACLAGNSSKSVDLGTRSRKYGMLRPLV